MTDSSTITRHRYGGARETDTVILTADNTSIREDADGFLVVELFRYDARTEKPLEGYQFRFCPTDRALLAKRV